MILATPDVPASMEEGLAGGFPIATTISSAFSQDLIGNLSGGDIYLIVILASVFVCTLAIQGAATRLMFSMGRDRHLPFGGLWGKVNTRFQTPANAAIAVGVIAAIPILVVGPIPAISISIAATGLIYVAYFMCNAGRAQGTDVRLAQAAGLVQPRPLGQARQHPGAGLRRPDDPQHRAVGRHRVCSATGARTVDSSGTR